MDYVIQKADTTRDSQKVVGFWTSNFPEWPPQKFPWFYQGNPSGEASFWLVNTGEPGTTVGTVALFPRIMYVNGTRKHACIIGDLIFAKAHRNLWPALALQREVRNDVQGSSIDFVYGSPNKQADQLLKRSGFDIIGTSITYKKPLRTYRHLVSRLKSSFLSRIFSFLLDGALFIVSRETYLARSTFRRLGGQPCDEFDKRFDRLWERGLGGYTIIGERSARFLNWRFAQCPYIDYRILALSSVDGKQVHGYVVYKMQDNELVVADLFVEDAGRYADHLFTLLLKHARRLGVESVVCSFLGHESLTRKLRKFGFLQTGDRRSFAVYADADSTLKEFFRVPGNWYFMECDNDI